MFHNMPKNIVVAGRAERQKVMVGRLAAVENSVENFSLRGLAGSILGATFASRESR